MEEKHTISLEYSSFKNPSELNPLRLQLFEKAIQATNLAYAPYSKFHVGAAIRTSAGNIVVGSNKENASFPAGTCAERNALGQCTDRFPDEVVESIAIAVKSMLEAESDLAPCGICRQVLCEQEKLQGSNIEIIVGSAAGRVLVFENANDLLPFHFYLDQLKK